MESSAIRQLTHFDKSTGSLRPDFPCRNTSVAALYYMINSVNNLLLPLPFPLFPYILLPAMVAELRLALWLVVAGVNESRWREQAGATVGENRTSA